MGLFGNKKKQRSNLPEVPEFPTIPEQRPEAAYQPEFQKQFPPSQQMPARDIPASPRAFDYSQGMNPIEPSPEFLKETGLPPMEHEDLENPSPESQQGLLPQNEPPQNFQRMPQQMKMPMPRQLPRQAKPMPHDYDDRMSVPMQHNEMRHSSDKPLFIKIDEYKESLRHLEMLKNKIEEIEDYMARLESIKAAEDDELAKCKTNVSEMKKSLMDVDRRLFEV
jgi:hypothetical protein